MRRNIHDLLVLCDMDNTLLSIEGGIPQCNKEVIRLFELLGGHFTVATGRTPESVRRALDGVTLTAPAVCCGGSVVYDFTREKLLMHHTLDRAAAHAALADIMIQFPGIGVEIMADCGQITIVQANPYTQKHLVDERIGCRLAPLSCAPDQWEKVLFAADPQTVKRLQKYVMGQEYPDTIYFLATNATYFEIMPRGVSKASGMQTVCESQFLTPESAIVVGDYYNDIELMCAAGYSVAMANAPQEVKMVADEVTDCRCFEGGVGEYLYKLIRECGC